MLSWRGSTEQVASRDDRLKGRDGGLGGTAETAETRRRRPSSRLQQTLVAVEYLAVRADSYRATLELLRDARAMLVHVEPRGYGSWRRRVDAVLRDALADVLNETIARMDWVEANVVAPTLSAIDTPVPPARSSPAGNFDRLREIERGA